MLNQLYNIPRTTRFILACSGGVDSMALLDFYRRGGKNFTVAYFDHGTGNAAGAFPIIQDYTNKYQLPFIVGQLTGFKQKDLSPEEFWRQERYKFFCGIPNAPIIVTAHHLADCVEGWLFSALHGNPRLMKCQTMLSAFGLNKTLIRPFLTNRKEDMIDWCIKHDVKWFEDKSNEDTHYPRNFIRHQLLEQCLKVNPGLFNTIRKKIIKETNIQKL